MERNFISFLLQNASSLAPCPTIHTFCLESESTTQLDHNSCHCDKCETAVPIKPLTFCAKPFNQTQAQVSSKRRIQSGS